MSMPMEAAPRPAGATRFRRLWDSARMYPYLSVLPAFITVVGIHLYPIAYAIYLSLHRYRLVDARRPFVGLRNFTDVINSYYFADSLIVTLKYTGYMVLGVVLYGLVVALYLNGEGRLQRFLRTVILLPWAIPIVMTGVIWKWIFNGNYGLLNYLLNRAGLIDQYISWLAHPDFALWSLLAASIWKRGPLAVIMCLAALQLIPHELYEAVAIDGGGFWARLRHVILPFLRPTLFLIVLLHTAEGLMAFDLIYVMTGGGPADATSLLAWFAYAETFRFLNLGKGAVLGLIIAALTGLFTLLFIAVFRPGREIYD
ncbi:MAG: sugar ABC transporter permease [Limnochordales bacterium]|nr:sugar ABC transporter permease [Limnochordales bacterium]